MTQPDEKPQENRPTSTEPADDFTVDPDEGDGGDSDRALDAYDRAQADD